MSTLYHYAGAAAILTAWLVVAADAALRILSALRRRRAEKGHPNR